jgi:large subunit ribosomal protein L38e
MRTRENMPIEIFNQEKFIELSNIAKECKIKKNRDNTKLKLRTPKYLYTIKLDHESAEELVKKLNCSTIEI